MSNSPKSSAPSAVDHRPALRAVYLHVVRNWALTGPEVIDALKEQGGNAYVPEDVTKLCLKELRTGLLNAEQVNGAGPLVYQSYFDIENEENVPRRAARAFDKAYPKGQPVVLTPKPSRKGHVGNSGPQYTREQIKKGLAARKKGMSWEAVAAEAGVKAASYFSKVVKSHNRGEDPKPAKGSK